MSDQVPRLQQLLNKIPFPALVPFFYLLWFSSILSFLVLSPVMYLYGMLRCAEVWIDWKKRGKDVLVVELDSPHSREWVSRLSPMISNRAVFINWSDRNNWEPSALGVQLFRVFGLQGIPEQFTAHSLPAAIVFRTFRRPMVFTFWERSRDREKKVGELSAVLGNS
jgi:hypothetical protein